jgi:hypothetical protein
MLDGVMLPNVLLSEFSNSSVLCTFKTEYWLFDFFLCHPIIGINLTIFLFVVSLLGIFFIRLFMNRIQFQRFISYLVDILISCIKLMLRERFHSTGQILHIGSEEHFIPHLTILEIEHQTRLDLVLEPSGVVERVSFDIWVLIRVFLGEFHDSGSTVVFLDGNGSLRLPTLRLGDLPGLGLAVGRVALQFHLPNLGVFHKFRHVILMLILYPLLPYCYIMMRRCWH